MTKSNNYRYDIPIRPIRATLDNLEDGRLSPEQEKLTLSNLRSLEWLCKMFETLPEDELIQMYFKIIEAIKDKSMPIDIMALSCMYYNFTAMWLDTTDLRDLINMDEYVQEGIKAMFKDLPGIFECDYRKQV